MSTLTKSYLRSQLSVNNSTLNKDYGLILYPPKLEFSNVVENESFTSVISIQNGSKTLKQIRIIGVTEKHKKLFTIHSSNTFQQLAAGCSIDIPITFLSKQSLSHSIYTELRIGIKDRMKDGQLNIETIVKIPSSNIEFESVLDFNTIVTKQTVQKTLLLTNIGHKKGFYKFEIPKKRQSQISIKPNNSGELDVNESIHLSIQLIAPNKLGIFRCLINVTMDNDANNTKTLDIICNVCEHKINFLMPKTKSNIQQINFGHLYFGQKRIFKGLLINNGPKSAHYSLYLKPNNKNYKNNANEPSNTHYSTNDNSEDKENMDKTAESSDIIEQSNSDEFNEDLQPIIIDNEEGTLDAYESKVITISYIPEMIHKSKGFTTTYNATNDISEMKLLLIIESAELIRIPLNGISFPVIYKLSQKTFDFGECCVHDRRDLYFELKNENKVMSLQYSFDKIACFKTAPNNGILLPLQSINILLTFLPKQLGNFRNVKVKLTFNNNPLSFDSLTVNGSSNQYLQLMNFNLQKSDTNQNKNKTRNHFGTTLVGGINKLPIDFKPNIKMIKNENNKELKQREITAIMKDKTEIHFDTELPNEKSAFYRPYWNTSTCVKGLYPNNSEQNISIINASSIDNASPNLLYTYSNADMLKRFSNKHDANDHMIHMRKKRKYFEKQRKFKGNNYGDTVSEAKEDESPQKCIERDMIDIGLNNFHGLLEPYLDLPKHKTDDLYLGDGQIINTVSDRLNFFKKCMMSKYDKKGSITKINENKLIKNKFKPIPETSAEIIDCQTTLTRKELKELKYGPNVMDLGNICVHSETAKNFSIVNTLKKTIMVQVKISSQNSQTIKSNPLSQVIPSQYMAGFDIIFNAKNIGVFAEDVTLLINGIHTISFKLKSEIISMDLQLSTEKLLFEFPIIDYLDFNLVKNVTLTNILGAPTKYKFDTNSINNKEIKIKPCSGIIKPNKSENIQFIWSPKALRPNGKAKETDAIKLQIIDGFDKIIQMQTVLPLSKCTLTNKSINFGLTAIGTEHTKRIHIKNIGHIQSIFRIIRCPPNLSIHPLYGKIDIGTSVALSITYLSLTQQSFDENVIIEVRGGKTLKLSVYAQTIIPQIAVQQNEFEFNGVTIGDIKSLPIEIINTSSVPAHLFLEMTANELYPNGTFDLSFPNEWSDLATEPGKAPIIPLPSVEEDELHTFMAPPKYSNNVSSNNKMNKSHQSSTKSLGVRFDISESRRASNRSSKRSLMTTMRSSRKSLSNGQIPKDHIRVVRSLDNPNLLNNANASQSSSTKKLKLETSLAINKNKSKKALNSPMMRRGSLLAMGQHLSLMKDLATESEQESSDSSSKKKNCAKAEDKQELRYRVLIQPNSRLKFKLTFNPKEIAQYDFDLNMTMAGIQFDDSLLLRKVVFGNGLKPRIALSTRNISFFDVTVLSESKAKQLPYHKDIIITNEENNKLEWKCKIKEHMHHTYSNAQNNVPWKIVPNMGILEPLKTSKMTIYFSPMTDELFRDNVDLLLCSTDKSESDSKQSIESIDTNENDVYLSIGLEGQASFPKLSFNQEFLLLPTVPLNCRSSKIILIKNHGYENLEIRYEVIDEKAVAFINLRFPNGRIIGGNGPNELKVEISILSATNISFTTRIDFLDIESNRFSVFVSGMADNCLLTNQPFLYNNDCAIGVVDSTSVVSKLQVSNAKKKVQIIENSLIPDDIPTNILCDVSVLIRYLEANCYLKFDSDIDAFPTDLVQSNGKMIFELVQFLSGKKIPGLKFQHNPQNNRSKKSSRKSSKTHSAVTTNRSNERKATESNQTQIERLIHNYAQLINFLKAHGALITIRPEYCLSCSQYIKFIQISSTMSSAPPSTAGNGNAKPHKFNELKSSKEQADTQQLKRQSERIHPMLSYVCWTQLLFQIIKLFVLNKITFPDFITQSDIAELIENEDSFVLKYISNMENIGNDSEENDYDEAEYKLNEERLTKSNVYTMEENILLLWVSVHCNKLSVHGNKNFFQSFSQLNDGIGIANLLKSYAPHIRELDRINTRTPLTDMDKNKNASIIIQSMKKLGLNIAINCDDITKPVERNICLLVLYLYQHLPNYKRNNAKNMITFSGNLNEEIIRKIHISNPSKISKICYEIVMEGDQQFELKNSSFIVLAPQASKKRKKTAASEAQKKKIMKKKTPKTSNHNSRVSSAKTEKSAISQPPLILEPETDVFISYQPRFMRPSIGRLTLLSKPFPDAIFPCKIPETMTFELKSESIESKPIKTIECKGRLYESSKVEFEVHNPYTQDCEFNIIIKNMSENETENENKIPSPWHCHKKSIKIKSEQSYKFSMDYLPFNMSNKHKCSITFMDSKCGEFLYFVIGETLLPLPIENVKLKCKDTESISHEINFKNNAKNPLLIKAKQIATNRMKSQNSKKESTNSIPLQSNPCIYDINVSSPFFVAPKQLKLNTNTSESKESNDASESLKITFNPKGPGCYPCTVTLKSHFISDKNTFNIGDIRIYEMEVTASSEGTHAEMEFNAYANEKILQKIPIVNSTDNDWRVTAAIIGDALHDFNTDKQKEFVVSSQSTNYYNLIYSPKWISTNAKAQLILTNHATNEKYIYDLTCTAKEPLAMDHIVLECQAKSTVDHEFDIENPYYGRQSVEYIIESDLQGVCVCGDTNIVIESNLKNKKYKLSLTPQCGGNIHGSISFIEKNSKRFVWYQMELMCSAPEPEQIIKISAYLREVVCVEINLSNPLNEIIEFNVSIIGEGLFGENRLVLQPMQKSFIYKLHYSPLVTGEIKGSVSFSNDISGEFWYSLILIGKKPPAIRLPDMICSVGNICTQQIEIENPFNEIIYLKQNENIMIKNANFSLQNKTKSIRINKSCVTPITLCYRPSLIGIKQSCDIVLKHHKLGEWNYSVFGLGKEPNIEKDTRIYAVLHSRISKVISFQNPFDQLLQIRIDLENAHKKAFQMFIKKKKSKGNNTNIYSIAPNSSLQIPIFFSPNTMKKYCSNLVISTNNYNERELIWNYPIIGLAQYKSSQLLNIKCNARETFHKLWNLNLDNYYSSHDHNDEFKIEIESNDSDKIIDESLQIDLIKKKISADNENQNNSLQIEVIFEPLRAFHGISKLHITNTEGVRWIFQLNFVVNKAEVDDIIKIESQLHCTSSVSFQLNLSQYNNEIEAENNEPIPFRTYFTADSPFEFDVNPKQGDFDHSKQSNGQQFIVSFTPNEYGAALNGKLIIETSVMEWSYKVIGTHPTYIPPNLNSFKPTVDDKISKRVQYKRKKEKSMIKNRNFLKKNISATKKQNK